MGKLSTATVATAIAQIVAERAQTVAGRPGENEERSGASVSHASASLASPRSSTSSPPSGAALVRAANRPAAVVAFEIEVVSFFLDAADLLGVPKSVAAIYGLCFATPEPLSFADLNERLDISMGSISQGVRVLREVGALKVADKSTFSLLPAPISRGASRRAEYYTPDMELRKLAVHFIENRLEKQLKTGKTRLKALATAVPERGDASTKELRDRLKYLQSWHSKASALVPLAKTALNLG